MSCCVVRMYARPCVMQERVVDVKPGRFVSWHNSEYTHRVDAGSTGRYMLGPMALLDSVLLPVGGLDLQPCTSSANCSVAQQDCCFGSCVNVGDRNITPSADVSESNQTTRPPSQADAVTTHALLPNSLSCLCVSVEM
jgi:hypothetical protein